jgi:hypothetical protein
MIHIRLDNTTHRELKVYAVKNDATVQSVVEELIHAKLAREQILTETEIPRRRQN